MEIGGERGRDLEPGAEGATPQGSGSPRGLTTIRASGRELRDFATQQIHIAHDQLDAFDAALAQHRAAREQIEGELEQSWNQLLELLLPHLDGPALAQVASRLGLPEMEPEGMARQSQQRRRALSAALAELDRDPTGGPAAADLYAALAGRRNNIEDLLGPLSEAITQLEAEPDFFGLLAVKYDSVEYRYRFWQPATYRHWRQARRLLRRHGDRLDAGRFGVLYKRYLHEKEAFRRLSHARDAVVARAAQVEVALRRRREIEMELGSLPSWALTFARARLRQQLADLTEEARLQVFAGEPPDAPGLAANRRVSALESRLRLLETARTECLDRPRAEVERALVKLLGVLSELLGPMRKLDAVHRRDDIEREYGLPLARWRELRSQHEQKIGEAQASASLSS